MPDLKDRFLSKVIKSNNGCWLWTAAQSHDGYGHFRVGKKIRSSHRASWELFRDKIPNGLLVLHACDNPLCVNPDHLFLGTDADNSSDRNAKLRQARGTRNGSAKFSEGDVRKIRELRRRGLTVKEVSETLSAPFGTVSNICSGHTWSWLT